MRRILATLTLTTGFVLGASLSAAANPEPPTNGGNGAGQSGQCTGSAHDRPASCQSP